MKHVGISLILSFILGAIVGFIFSWDSVNKIEAGMERLDTANKLLDKCIVMVEKVEKAQDACKKTKDAADRVIDIGKGIFK